MARLLRPFSRSAMQTQGALMLEEPFESYEDLENKLNERVK